MAEAERVELKDLVVKNLKPTDRDRIVWDTVLTNFGVRVRTSGRKSYVVVRRVAGSLKWVTVGDASLPLAKARKAAADAIIEMGAGTDPVAEKRKAKAQEKAQVEAASKEAERTFGARFEIFKRRHIAQQKPRTQKESERPFTSIFLPKWKDRDLASITREEIGDVLESILTGLEAEAETRVRTTGREVGTVGVAANRARTALTTFFNFAVDRGWVPSNPVPRRNLVKEGARDRVLTDDELARIWHAAKGTRGPYGRIVQLAILTAARRTEVAEARWDEIDGGVWTLPAGRTKAKREHVIPLPRLALDVLDEIDRIEDCPFLFSTDGRHAVQGFSKWHAALNEKAAGLDVHGKELANPAPLAAWGLHDLRRTCATWMETRYPMGTLKAVLNHSKGAGVTGVYARHEYMQEKRDALAAWAQHVAAITSPPAGNVVRMPKARA